MSEISKSDAPLGVGLWLRPLHEGLVEAAAEATKDSISHSFLHLIPAAFAGPAGAAAAAILKVLFLTVEERSTNLARQLNVILDEPFLTATRTLHEVAAAQIRSPDEVEEVGRQLKSAYDNLSKAFSFAHRNDPTRSELIQIYRGITAALMPGGAPFARIIVGGLRSGVLARRAHGARLQHAAQSIDVDTAVEQLKSATRFRGASSQQMDHLADIVVTSLNASHLASEKTRLMEDGERLLTEANDIEKICDLIGQWTRT
ncbi:MAG: hypothetical protein JO328_01755 [Hyphomicrobiales bacterium]|nr:hypothetical protein [Hyphomicrobiales bacterium]MBV8825781.1 hypothetical protein [Hyphomicrobiales bacterium]